MADVVVGERVVNKSKETGVIVSFDGKYWAVAGSGILTHTITNKRLAQTGYYSTGITVRLPGMLHCGNIENDMVPITLLQIIAMRTSGFYPNPVTFTSDNNTVIH